MQSLLIREKQGAVNIGNNANAKTITIGNTTGATNVVLTKGASGNITLTGFNCTGNANGGALTTDASGNISCSDDNVGSGAVWSALTDPTGNLTLAMANYTTAMNWINTGALNAWTMTLNNNAGSVTTQNLMVLKNAVSSQTTDVTTESLLLLDNADTSTSGSTLVANGILVTNSGAITRGITDAIDASAAEIDNALNFGTNTILGTTGDINMDNFDVTGSSGNIVTAGTLAVNGDSITADGATLIINAAGNVDVQDALNADSITSDAGVSIAANNSYTGAGIVTLDSATTNALNIGTGANSKTITIGNNQTNTNIVLTKGASGNITFTGFNCSTYTNGGTLTTDASGNIACANDDAGGGTSYWNVASGAMYANNTTLDVLIGGTATSSAKFAFTGMTAGTPTASISGATNIATFIDGNGNISTTNRANLTLGKFSSI